MTWTNLSGTGVTYRPSPLESARFGVGIGRVMVGAASVWDRALEGDLVAACDHDDDVVVVRWPSSMVRCGSALVSTGRDVLPADVLTYWETRSAEVTPTADEAGLTLTAAASLPDAVIEGVVRRVFAGYVNHYAANPLLSTELALDGYVEWALSAVHQEGSVVLAHDGVPVGIATWVLEPDAGLVEVLLAGMVQEARRRGWYASLLAAAGRFAQQQGVDRVVISTQAANVDVQRAWARLGFAPFASVTTAHAVRRGLLPGSAAARA